MAKAAHHDIPGTITSPAVPGAVFFSREALHEFVHDALAYEAAVAAFERGGDEFALAVDLEALGFEPAEIEWHTRHPGQRMVRGYIVPDDVGQGVGQYGEN